LLSAALRTVALAIGSAFAKIENCPIRFRPYRLEHAFGSASSIGLRLGTNYTIQALTQSYIVLFSSEVLGNPVRLLQGLSEGLWDFVYLPTVGLMTLSPQAFLLGAMRGTSSLVRSLLASVCTSAGALASSLQVGLVALGAEEGGAGSGVRSRLLSARSAQEQQQRRPSSVLAGVQMGLAGALLDPLWGFKGDGVRGLIVGAVKGGVGLFARPLYGALGSASK
ncbi:hypothetical protein B484DRAFT_320058, partial [Ochromonadaceae sp. CCMP2298]